MYTLRFAATNADRLRLPLDGSAFASKEDADRRNQGFLERSRKASRLVHTIERMSS